MKARKIIKDVYHYLIGNYRYYIYYNFPTSLLIREQIREQIEFRINSMDRQCYSDGSCKLCGCKTTALQMADKACDKPCYPKMIDCDIWKIYKAHSIEFIYERDEEGNNMVWKLDWYTKTFTKWYYDEEV